MILTFYQISIIFNKKKKEKESISLKNDVKEILDTFFHNISSNVLKSLYWHIEVIS